MFCICSATNTELKDDNNPATHCIKRFLLHTSAACCTVLTGGVVAKLLFTANLSAIALLDAYLFITPFLIAGYLYTIIGIYRCPRPEDFFKLILESSLLTPMCAVFILFFFLLLLPGRLCELYCLLWFLVLIRFGRRLADLRPFRRAYSDETPWIHHDGGLNSPDALFFRKPPEWIGEVISAGSSLRRGDELPTQCTVLLLTLWSSGLAFALFGIMAQFPGYRGGAGLSLAELPFLLAVSLVVGILATLIMLFRLRVCSYVGTLGAVEYRLDRMGAVQVWAVRYDDYQTLKVVSKHHTWLAVYDGSRGYRRFESADGTTGKDYSFAWNAVHRAEAQPEVQFHFWCRIEEQLEKLGKPVAG